MPHNYIQKTTERYPSDDLNASAKEVRIKGITWLNASKKHGVPRSTLKIDSKEDPAYFLVV